MKDEKDSSIIEDNPRTQAFFIDYQRSIYEKTDILFSRLMPIQWIASIIIAYTVSPSTWYAARPEIHPHVLGALIVGGLITIPPTLLAYKYPGKNFTRYIVAVCQMLMSSMLIHLMGGRIETHFHVFGSLAFLAFYRDWKVLIPATILTAADHIIRGWIYPQSVYGILTGGEWRWVEHAAWVVFEDFFLIISCRTSINEMWKAAVNMTILDDNEARFRAVVEQTTEGIFLLSPQTLNVIECNDAFVNLIGYENIEEVKRLNAFDVDIAKPEEIERMTRIVREENSSLSAERKYRKKDGSIIHVEIIGRCINYRENVAYCINVRDITKRKKVEIEVKRLALVAQKTQNGVVITDPEGKIQWVNDGFTRITGYQFEEVVNQKPGHILQGRETNPKTIEEIRQALQEQKPFAGEIFNYNKEGKGYWVSISIMPIHSKAGQLKGFIGVQTDISSQKEMENALRQARDEMEQRVSERTAELLEANEQMSREVEERKRTQLELSNAQQFLRKVIDNVPNMIFVKDKHRRYTLVNRALANIYGLPVKNIIGKTDAELIPNPDEAEKFLNDDKQILETGEEKFIFEQKFTDRKGNTHWLHTVKRPMISDTGVENILGIATDLTERKILESQLRHAQKLESIGQLAAGIAHEINTPTQYVSDNTRFIRDAFTNINRVLAKYDECFQKAEKGSLNPQMLAEIKKEIEDADLEYLIEEVPNAVQQSLEGVSRIARIVQSMKDFAHPGAKEKTAVDLNRAIESTITVARNEWKYVAEMETHFDPNLPPVPCLLGEFNQVVLNMVINASHAIKDVVGDASHGKGKITVSTTKVNDDWAEIRVADTGTGIPPEIQSRVFDPFFTTKEVGKGTGQGLAISHTVVVEKHNGKLSFETESGKGTTFIIQLPLNETSDEKGI